MSSPDSATLTLESAQQLLRRFLCIKPGSDDNPDPVLVRQALLQVAEHSDYQIFGICADNGAQASGALKTYLTALGYEVYPDVALTQEEALYVKYNPKTGRCHTDSYLGEHRGVLVSCQSAYDGDINETFGHLPLDLFMG